MLVCLASKLPNPPLTRTCKLKKIYNCATVSFQIYDNTVAQSQISYVVFYSKSLLFLSLQCLFSSPSLQNNSSSSLSHLSLAHDGGYFLAWGYVRHGSWVWWRELDRGSSDVDVGWRCGLLVSDDRLLSPPMTEICAQALPLIDDWDL